MSPWQKATRQTICIHLNPSWACTPTCNGCRYPMAPFLEWRKPQAEDIFQRTECVVLHCHLVESSHWKQRNKDGWLMSCGPTAAITFFKDIHCKLTYGYILIVMLWLNRPLYSYSSSKWWSPGASWKAWRSNGWTSSSLCFTAWICRLSIKMDHWCETRVWSRPDFRSATTDATGSCNAAIYKRRAWLSSLNLGFHTLKREWRKTHFLLFSAEEASGGNAFYISDVPREGQIYKPTTCSSCLYDGVLCWQTGGELLTSATMWTFTVMPCIDSHLVMMCTFAIALTPCSLLRICRVSFWNEEQKHCLLFIQR